MIRILLVLNHVQAGLGNESFDSPPCGKRDVLGPGKMMKSFLESIGGEIIATLYCGDVYYKSNTSASNKKFISMIKKLKPDVVICGPAFHYESFGYMASSIAKEINEKLNIPSFAVMSSDNLAVNDYKEEVIIVRTPNKGEDGLYEAIKNICNMAIKLGKKEDIEEFKKIVCL